MYNNMPNMHDEHDEHRCCYSMVLCCDNIVSHTHHYLLESLKSASKTYPYWLKVEK